MAEYLRYRRKQIAELADWTHGFDMSGVSISEADKQAGSPKTGDKIARNPANHADRWLVAADYFAVNFEPIDGVQDRFGDADLAPGKHGGTVALMPSGVPASRPVCPACNGRGWETVGTKCTAPGCDGGYIGPRGVQPSDPVRENRELRDLLREAGEVIKPMADWFRNQPLGAPPAGTAQLQANIRRVLAAAGVQPSFVADADALLRELVVSIEEYEKVECIDVGRVRRKRRDAAFAKAQAYARGVALPATARQSELIPCARCTSEIYCEMNGCKWPRAAMTSTTAKE